MRVSRAKRAAIVFETFKDGTLFSHRAVGEMFDISPSAGRDIILRLRREMPEGFKVITRAGMGLENAKNTPVRSPRGGHKIVRIKDNAIRRDVSHSSQDSRL